MDKKSRLKKKTQSQVKRKEEMGRGVNMKSWDKQIDLDY